MSMLRGFSHSINCSVATHESNAHKSVYYSTVCSTLVIASSNALTKRPSDVLLFCMLSTVVATVFRGKNTAQS